MTCSVVKELMPNYIDGLTSDETSEDIKKTSCELRELLMNIYVQHIHLMQRKKRRIWNL